MEYNGHGWVHMVVSHGSLELPVTLGALERKQESASSSFKSVYSKQPILGLTQEFCWVCTLVRTCFCQC